MFRNISRACMKICEIRELTNITPKRYAGHSKWQNIRHIKGAKDAERSALFQKIARQMKVAIAENGSSDPKSNIKLENIIEQAKRSNMPAATIQSIIKSCEGDKSNSKSSMVEIKGPGGCIILCEVFTNNLHAVKQNISTILRKNQGKYTDGGGMHLFDEKGIIEVDVAEGTKPADLLEQATEHAIESGAEDVNLLEESNQIQFICGATSLKSVTAALEKFNYKIASASVEFIPLKFAELSESDLELCAKLIEKLENLPEVTRVSENIA